MVFLFSLLFISPGPKRTAVLRRLASTQGRIPLTMQADLAHTPIPPMRRLPAARPGVSKLAASSDGSVHLSNAQHVHNIYSRLIPILVSHTKQQQTAAQKEMPNQSMQEN